MKKEKRQVKVNKSRNFAFLIVLFSFSFFIFNFALSTDANAATISKPTQSLGLVGYWSFDVGKGTAKAIDMSGRGNNGTLTNMNTTAAWVGGKIGNALNFDGVNDYVTMGDAFYLDALTISGWIKSSNVSSVKMIIHKRNTPGVTTATMEWQMYQNSDGKIYFQAMNPSEGEVITLNSFTSVQLNTWYFITVAVPSSGIGYMYINGVQEGSGARTGTIVNTTSEIQIGSRSNNTDSRYFSGLIDDVRVYNRALSPDEIKRLYRQTSPQFNASQAYKLRQGLVGMWTFDGNDMSGNTAIDRSGNGNNGTLTNGPKKAIGRIGQGLNFDGVDDLVTASSDFIGTSPLTISAWIKPNTLGESSAGGIVNNGKTGFRLVTSNRLIFSSNGEINSYVSAVNAFVLGQWTHVLATRDASGVANIYVNGVITGTANQSSGTPIGGTTNVVVGNNSAGSNTFNGLIDEVRVYNRALTPAEIRQLYKAGSSFHPNVTNKSTIRDGLVGHWSFDGADMGTTSARDASGAGNTGWLINGTKKTVGKVGQALSFDGVDDLVDVGSASSLDNITVKTLAAWIYPRTHGENNTGQIIQKEENSNQWRLQIDNNSAACQGGGGQKICFRQQFSTMAGVWRSANNTVPLNTWTHVAVVYDRGSTANDPVFYINGVSVAITEQTTPSGDVADDNTLRTSIGARRDNGGSAFDGLIDEVRIYNRALTQDEIKRLYNMGR